MQRRVAGVRGLARGARVLRARLEQTQTECGGKCPTKKWPAYSRVNHAKYIVSDGRLNVGTSNWQWGYFHNTAGLSFNTDGAALVATAQAIFDADWASAYAVPLAT